MKKKGNVVRFYLGQKTEEWGYTNPGFKDYTDKTPDWLKPRDRFWGDDWNDRPYECNAGSVYPEFVYAYTDIAFPFDSLVLEPCNNFDSSEYSKEDMVKRRVPCIIEVPLELQGRKALFEYVDDDFHHWVGADGIKKYYFGDELDPMVYLRYE